MPRRKHTDRVWFVGDINDDTNDYICRDAFLEGFDPDTDFIVGACVKEDGQTTCKNLVRLPSRSAVTTLESVRKKRRLKFRVFVRESPGAIIVPWIGNTKRTSVA